jgi:hypothetical protein
MLLVERTQRCPGLKLFKSYPLFPLSVLFRVYKTGMSKRGSFKHLTREGHLVPTEKLLLDPTMCR